jgi:hypothetical protein
MTDIDKTAPLEGETTEAPDTGEDWLRTAKEAFNASTTYLDANYREQWERNVCNFRSKHPPGSKYYTDKYKSRSKLFRPKTRTAVFKNEAAFASAMFSTDDVVAVEAHDPNDPQAAAEAEIWQAIANYRLQKTIPWFRIATGAFQEAQIYGAVISKQEWDREERVTGFAPQVYGGQPMIDDATGGPVMLPMTETIKNEPKIRLLEIENARFDPAADWTDPVNSSPYFIELIPMFVVDVLQYMDLTDPETGEPYWYQYSKEEIAASRKSDNSTDGASTRSARSGGQTDKYTKEQSVKDFDIVWVHLNFMRLDDGEDVFFYTLGTEKLLSDPQPVKGSRDYPAGRPYRIGVCTIEAHQTIPASIVQMGQDLQASANDMENQRRDNVNLMLNGRYVVARNRNVDLMALRHNVPGGIVMTDDVNAVQWQQHRDVTASAYHEQDRLNADFDDLTGTFAGGSVQTNRALNETVGGMNLMSASANATTEYIIRTFVETWCEPVIQQLIELEQANEAENVRRMFVRDGAELSGARVDVRVNVGFGSTDPQKRLVRLLVAADTLAKVSPRIIQRLNDDEIIKEVFGAAGYRDGDRFIQQGNPAAGGSAEAQMTEMKLQIEQGRLQIEQMKLKLEESKALLDAQVKREKIAADTELGYAKLSDGDGISEEKAAIEREKLQTQREIAALKAANDQNELAFKADSGRQGI